MADEAAILIALRLIDHASLPFARALASMQAESTALGSKLGSVSSVMGSIGTSATHAAAAIAGMAVAVGAVGVKFNQQVESSTVGIASLLSAQGKFRDSQGQELSGREKINTAIKYSSDLVKQLQVDNMQTTATFEELLNAFQVTLAPGLSKGLNVDQIRQYTLAMVQAAAAMQVPLDQMAEETRSLLTGTITPRNTRIATALGITADDVKKWEGNADGWFNWVMGRLDAFQQFGGILGNTFSGLLSNVKDSAANVLGRATLPVFEDLKARMKEFYDYAVQVDGKTRTVTLNPELIQRLEIVNDALRSGIDLVDSLVVGMGKLGDLYANSRDWFFPKDRQDAKRSNIAQQAMQDIKDAQTAIDAVQQSSDSAVASLLTAYYEWSKNSSISTLKDMRDEMARAGQNTKALDEFLASLKITTDQFSASQYDAAIRIGGVSYEANKAIPSLDDFKKKLQEVAGINLTSLTQNLANSIEGLQAKLAVAAQGGDTRLQNIAAEYAEMQKKLDISAAEARKSNAPISAYVEIAKDRELSEKKRDLETKIYLEDQANKAAKKASSGPGPRTAVDIDQYVRSLESKKGDLSKTFKDLSYELEASIASGAGRGLDAELINIEKQYQDTYESIWKKISEAQGQYMELEQKLGGKRGGTAEAFAELAKAKKELDAAWSTGLSSIEVAEKIKQVMGEQASKQWSAEQSQTVAQLNVEYITLTGTMREQYEAQMQLIDASLKYNTLGKPTEVIEAYRKLADEQKRVLGINRNGTFFEGMQDEARVIGNQIPTAAMQGREALRSFSDGIKDTADALAEFSATGKIDIDSLTNTFIKDLLKMQYQTLMMKAMFGGSDSSAGGGLVGWITSLFGGGSSLGYNVSEWKNVDVGLHHLGGMAGYPPQTIQVPAHIFHNAPRLHGGLKPDEYPAVLQTGEEVVSRSERSGIHSMVRALTKMIADKRWNVNVINNAPGVKTDQRQNSDGSLEVIIDQVEGAVASRIAKGRSQIGSAMESTYALNRGVGLRR